MLQFHEYYHEKNKIVIVIVEFILYIFDSKNIEENERFFWKIE